MRYHNIIRSLIIALIAAIMVAFSTVPADASNLSTHCGRRTTWHLLDSSKNKYTDLKVWYHKVGDAPEHGYLVCVRAVDRKHIKNHSVDVWFGDNEGEYVHAKAGQRVSVERHFYDISDLWFVSRVRGHAEVFAGTDY